MASKIEVDEIMNAGGDNDTGIDIATNDQILLKVANSTKLTMNSTGQTTIVGEGGTTTTSLQQGLAKAWAKCDEHTVEDSFNVSGSTDNGTGDYTISISNDIARVEYSVTLSSGATQNQITAQAAGSYRRVCSNSSGSAGDVNFVNSTVHGDLA